jgi:hypothetical protein
MPNESPKSSTVRAIESLFEVLEPAERARLRSWILAKYDVRGYLTSGYTPPS